MSFSSKNVVSDRGGDEVLLCGLYRKLNTIRKKWFVLRAETAETSARLEYYDSKKKYLKGRAPNKSIPIKNCFNINKIYDKKYKHVIALYNKDDCFCMVLETAEELDSWLKTLLRVQHGEETIDGEVPKPIFEHMWQVVVTFRSLGRGRTGQYRLCLTTRTLTLIRNNCNTSIILYLWHIRSCGNLDKYIYIEIGRSSVLGAGELWITSEDKAISKNICDTINIYINKGEDEAVKEMRSRASSATECSKPRSNKRPAITGSSTTTPASTITSRERCDSASSRPRTRSEGGAWRSFLTPSYRSRGRDISHSPPSGSPISPPSVGGSNSTTGSSFSLMDEEDNGCVECSVGADVGRYNNIALTPDGAIAEEDCPENSCGKPHRDDGYIDMLPSNKIQSPTASTSSVVSGTPSTDLRFVDYPLDKVTSYFTEEDASRRIADVSRLEDDSARPARAYSFGSNPESVKGKKHIELSDSARVRAFSVGSKTKKWHSRIFSQHYHPSSKSISAPMLNSSRSQNSYVINEPMGSSSYSSNDPMGDLMEMDFSKGPYSPSNNNYTVATNNIGSANTTTTTTTANNDGYVEMKPGVITRPVEIAPYVDMSGSTHMDVSSTSPSSKRDEELNSFVDLSRQYRLSHNNNNYVDMDNRKNKAKTSTSPGWSQDYFDMSGSNHSRRSERGSSFSSQLSGSSPRNTDYLSMNFSPQENPKTPEGYVEMSVGKRHQRQASLDGNQIVTNNTSDDYLNMSVGSKKKLTKNQLVMSQPISIHSATNAQPTKNSSSPISLSSWFGRKSSTGTPPKMHLPLSWSSSSLYSSLPRTRARKDSKDSSSSSVTTPSGSSTIFPMSLNSPSSPLKSNKPDTPSQKIQSFLNAIYKPNSKPTPSEDYAFMDFDNKRTGRDSNDSDYMNHAPFGDRSSRGDKNDGKKDSSSNDYAFMQPSTRGLRHDTQDTSLPLISHLSMMGIKDSQSMCFQPIKEDATSSPTNEENRNASESYSDYMDLSLPHNEVSSRTSKMSRPNSVNSELGSGVKSNSDKVRPASVTSDNSRANISRPSSTSSELWSSSSTLVNSRPESVNSDREDKRVNKLHYASLDLSSREAIEDQSVASQVYPTPVYAEINFAKSDVTKQNNGNSQSLDVNTNGKN